MFTMTATDSHPRIDWGTERDRIDLVDVVTDLLGEPPGRRGERSQRTLWWSCPFHHDPNPSFCVQVGDSWWRCRGCDEHGDAATLVMKVEGITFPEVIRRLVGDNLSPTTYRPPPRPPAHPSGPKGVPLADALALVEQAEIRLWSPEGANARAYLATVRHLDETTIRAARLGWTLGVTLPTQNGRTFTASGIVIPWFDGDRLALVKIRQPGDARPKYAEAFRDRPTILFGSTGGPGQSLVIVEGEFDALLVGQMLRGRATVATFGPASIRPEPETLARFHAYHPWYVATDADEAGDRAAEAWPRLARRVRPPEPFNDWTEAAQAGIDLRRWWADRLAGITDPLLLTWTELAAQRWAGADKAPAVVINQPDPERRALAWASLETASVDWTDDQATEGD